MRSILLFVLLSSLGLAGGFGWALAEEEEPAPSVHCPACWHYLGKDESLVCATCGKAVDADGDKWFCPFCKQNTEALCERCYDKRKEDGKKK